MLGLMYAAIVGTAGLISGLKAVAEDDRAKQDAIINNKVKTETDEFAIDPGYYIDRKGRTRSTKTDQIVFIWRNDYSDKNPWGGGPGDLLLLTDHYKIIRNLSAEERRLERQKWNELIEKKIAEATDTKIDLSKEGQNKHFRQFYELKPKDIKGNNNVIYVGKRYMDTTTRKFFFEVSIDMGNRKGDPHPNREREDYHNFYMGDDGYLIRRSDEDDAYVEKATYRKHKKHTSAQYEKFIEMFNLIQKVYGWDLRLKRKKEWIKKVPWDDRREYWEMWYLQKHE